MGKNGKPCGIPGDRYVPYEERTGNQSIVYFTRDLSAAGLRKIYERVDGNITGNVGGEAPHRGEERPQHHPREWVRELLEKDLPEASIIETNTYYQGDRYTTADHRETLKVNGWTFCPVDIMDAEGAVLLPVQGGKWFSAMSMGKNLTNYDSLVALTHFKGHSKGGFGGSNKNIGIGCADGQVGKKMIHTTPGSTDMWDISFEEFMERMTESAKAAIDFFGKRVAYVNVLRNMSVDCDCAGVGAAPVVTPNIGICASHGYFSGGPGLCGLGLRPEGGGPPRPGGAHGVPPRIAPAHLYERAGHGQRQVPAGGHRPRRPIDLPAGGRTARPAL